MTDNQFIDNGVVDAVSGNSAQEPENEPEEEAEMNETEVEVRSVPKPRYTYAKLASQVITELRRIAKDMGVTGFSALRKDDLIIAILALRLNSLTIGSVVGPLRL